MAGDDLHRSNNGGQWRATSARRSICRRGGSATARRARASRSSSSTATWSTAGSGTASSTGSPTDFRCIAPDWPIGAQQIAMKPDADLSPHGVAGDDRRLPRGARPRGRDDRRQRLRRRDVPGPRHPPPGADRPPRADQLRHPRELPAGDLQGDAAAGQAAGRDVGPRPPRSGSARSLARAFRPFAKIRIPAELVASWMQPGAATTPASRDDLKKVTVGMNKRYTLEAAEKLRGSQLPILLAWAPGDSFFPISLRRTARRRSRQRPDRRDPRRQDLRPARSARALAEEIAAFAA